MEPAANQNVAANQNPLTRIERKLYEAAVQGNFDEFINVQNIKNLLTPNKNTILHLHLTSQIPTKASEDFVRKILDKCGDLVQQPNAKAETPLHIAARYGHSNIVRLLIERAQAFRQDVENGIGADKELIRAKNHENDTALHEAVLYCHIEVVKILTEKDPNHLYLINNAKETPLYLAIERQYVQIVYTILENLTTPTYDGPNGLTALHAAVINNDIEMVRYLVEKEHLRASIKHGDTKGWVPLHHAVKIGYYDMTKLLLEQDGNAAYMKDSEGRTALHIAAHNGHWILMKMIIKYYPDCSELIDNKGWNALHYAVNGDSYYAMKKILHNQLLSNLYNEKDIDGNTPLHHLAASLGTNPMLVYHPQVSKLVMNKEHQTALDVAYANSDSAITQSLIWDLKNAGGRGSRRLHLHLKEVNEKSQKLVFSKEATESHLLVATLIATVSFAAGFTLPGGTRQDGKNEGSAILGQRAAFKAFIITDTVALVLSASAVFIHLFSPLNKANSKDGFLSEIAFSFTLVAVAAMIVAFVTGTYAVLESSSIGIAVLSIGLLFFLVFKQVLDMNFRRGYVFAFTKNVVNVILFSIMKINSETVGPLFRSLLSFRPSKRGRSWQELAIFMGYLAIDYVFESIEKVRVQHKRRLLKWWSTKGFIVSFLSALLIFLILTVLRNRP